MNKPHHFLLALLIGLLVPSSAVAEHTLYCNFDTASGKPFAGIEMKMYSWGKFSEKVRVHYYKDDVKSKKPHEESLTVEKTKGNQMFSFVMSKEYPENAMRIVVYDDVMSPNDLGYGLAALRILQLWPVLPHGPRRNSHSPDHRHDEIEVPPVVGVDHRAFDRHADKRRDEHGTDARAAPVAQHQSETEHDRRQDEE